jgi:hypothetical protein
MKDIGRKIEIFANVAIIGVALVLAGTLVRTYILPRPVVNSSVQNAQLIHPGTRFSSQVVDWGKNNQTLVLALSQKCHYCSESANFYKRIVESHSRDTRLIALLPQDAPTGQKYLQDLGVSVDEVKQASLDSIGVQGTPTLLLVDKDGVVQNVWIGKLSENEESEVLAKLK